MTRLEIEYVLALDFILREEDALRARELRSARHDAEYETAYDGASQRVHKGDHHASN